MIDLNKIEQEFIGDAGVVELVARIRAGDAIALGELEARFSTPLPSIHESTGDTRDQVIGGRPQAGVALTRTNTNRDLAEIARSIKPI